MALKFRAVEHHKGNSAKPVIELLNFGMLVTEIQKGTTIVCDGLFDSMPGVFRVTIKKLADSLKELPDDNTK